MRSLFHTTLLLFYLFLSGNSCSKEPSPPDTRQHIPSYSKVPSKLGFIHQMQGRWKDSRIKDAELLITGNKFISIYKDEIRSRATFKVFDKCPKVCRSKKQHKGIAYFIVYRADGNYCYVLDNLRDGVLEYTPLDHQVTK